jgi:peptidoglycan-associated lipoprotein
MPILSYFLMIALIVAMAGCDRCRQAPVDEPVAPPVEEKAPEPEVIVEKTPEPDPVPVQIEREAPLPPSAQILNDRGVLQTVYFGFDSSTLNDQARTVLRANADWLKANTGHGHGIVMGGHCDERGTKEYNLALGERRASAARDYLASLGVDASVLRVISFGEEDPAVSGHNEDAWAKNRRCTFTFE